MVIVRIVREAAALAAAMKIELTDMPPLPVPSIVHASDAQAVEIIRGIGQKFLDTSPEHRMSAQQDVLRGSRLEYQETLGYALQKARELGRAHADARCLLPHHLAWPTHEWGCPFLPSKWGRTSSAPCAAAASRRVRAPTSLSDDFESHAAGELPGAPWKRSHLQVRRRHHVDAEHAFSGKQALHVLTPRGAKYRRGYVAIHLKRPLPDAQPGMYGRAMVLLDAAPIALPDAPPVHWTLLQGEGRSADDRYNSIYRLGRRGRGRHAAHGQLRDHAAGHHRLQAEIDAHAARAALDLRRMAFGSRLE